jgi:dihydroflavonol-4-reductase
LITGGAGFIGSHLARALRQAGRPVRILIRPTSDLWRLEGLDVGFVVGDVLLPNTLPEALDGVEVIYHLAGLPDNGPNANAVYRDLHVHGTLHVLVAAQAAGVSRFVHVSSAGVVGAIEHPPADETWPRAPSNVYELTKSEGEQLALSFAERTGLPVTVIRPGFVYGPGDARTLPLFRAVRDGRFFLIGAGESCVQPTFVGDAVRGMLLGERAERKARVYQIVGPEPVSVRRLAATIADALGVSPPQRRVPRFLARLAAGGADLMTTVSPFRSALSRRAVRFLTETRTFSTARAQAELGYRAQVSLAEGVCRTVAWYRGQGWL